MLKAKTTASNKAWNNTLRSRVGDSIKHAGSSWVNITGKNSEPGVGLDWENISPAEGLKVFSFSATHNQVVQVVPSGVISDDGLWSVQVGSFLLNSTTGITSFAGGGITINFITGQITFNEPLQGGTQIIIKHN